MSRIQTHIMAGMLLLAGCSVAPPRMASGYVEGDYVYVAAPEGGWITEVLVSRGQSVKPGDALFSLDSDTQLARRDQARAQLDQALSQLADATKSRRPDEVDALEALQSQSRAALTLADSNYSRATDLKKRGFVAQSFLDARRADRDTAAQALRQASANLALARKGARDDVIASAKSAVAAARASLSAAAYALDQRRIKARVGGRIEDTLRHRGEFVTPGGAILQMLPPENIRLRFFVPEALRARVRTGASVDVACDGCRDGIRAKITFLSATAEYTPPVIYSVGSREKLVWLVEAVPEAGVHLSPGQPVDVKLP